MVATPSGPNQYAFTQRPIRRKLHPDLPPTPLWAYDDGSGLAGQAGSFGMVLAAQSGTPLHVSYTNHLPETYPDWIPVDTRLTDTNGREVRPMTHLHGGFVAADSDGNPITDGGAGLCARPDAARPLRQPAAADAGLAALVPRPRDGHHPAERVRRPGGRLPDPGRLRHRHRAEPDRGAGRGLRDPAGDPGPPCSARTGRCCYPVSDIPGVTWIGEYFGDHMLVNGKVWPYLDVEPRMYRFRVLNGCNARIMSLRFGGLPMWQIGAEGGLFDIAGAGPRSSCWPRPSGPTC